MRLCGGCGCGVGDNRARRLKFVYSVQRRQESYLRGGQQCCVGGPPRYASVAPWTDGLACRQAPRAMLILRFGRDLTDQPVIRWTDSVHTHVRDTLRSQLLAFRLEETAPAQENVPHANVKLETALGVECTFGVGMPQVASAPKSWDTP